MQLAHDYCEEMTGSICVDALRLELLHETNEMRKRAFLLPKDSMVHKLPAARNGEHQYAAYQDQFADFDDDDHVVHNIHFYDDDTKRISNLWAVPSFSEICSMENQMGIFTNLNHSKLYKFELGNPTETDEYGRPILPEFTDNNQKKLIKMRLPKLTLMDISAAESALGNHQRISDFQECYKYTNNRILNQMYYLRQFQNLFDLEFFANKLPSKSYSIAGLEQSVMSGAPFWDDFEDAESSEDDYIKNENINNPMYADQSDAVESPHRNQLALKVVARVAEEKRAKMKLLQEIELIKDKFAEWEKHMRGLELHTDIKQAGEFLNQLV